MSRLAGLGCSEDSDCHEGSSLATAVSFVAAQRAHSRSHQWQTNQDDFIADVNQRSSAGF